MLPPPRAGSPRPGGYLASDIQEGEPYEVSNGRLVACPPAGDRHSEANSDGAALIASDPAVEGSGVDVGFELGPKTLRAPDVGVGPLTGKPGWVKGAPTLAVEYADTGQDMQELRAKIEEFLDAGTRYVWVVRLTGERRIEVHEPGKPVRIAYPGEDLTAPGVLQNPVPVIAMFDRKASQEVTLRNLLNRRGYENLQHAEEKNRAAGWNDGLIAGRVAAITQILEARGLVTADAIVRVIAEKDLQILDRWIVQSATATTLEDALK